MNVALCTITFRHHLLSLADLAAWAAAQGFQGIELWAPHARNLDTGGRYDAAWLAGHGLNVPMVSDYLPLEGDSAALIGRADALCRLAGQWRARKIRVFAGTTASADTPADRRAFIAGRLRTLASLAADHGLLLVVETHPGTLADTLSSTHALIGQVDHPAFRINFDVLHVWEGGDDPLAAHATLRPHIAHYHLKNIRARSDLGVFAPANVYSAAGTRDGMVPLFDGAVDYPAFLATLDADAEVSLEWFGGDCFDVLRRDRRALARLVARRGAPASFWQRPASSW